jgi:hypothetical protein
MPTKPTEAIAASGSLEELRERWQRQLARAQHELGAKTALIGLAISWHLNRQTGMAFPGLSTLAALTGVSHRTARRAVAKLVAAGHMTRTQIRKGTPNHYRAILKDGDAITATPTRDKAMTLPQPITATPTRDRAVTLGGDRAVTHDRGQSCDPFTSYLTSDEPPIRAVAPATSRVDDNSGKKKPARKSDWPEDYREMFWQAYPRKVGKKKALNRLDAIEAASEVSFARLLSAIGKIEASDPKYIPHPKTWLNDGRYLDGEETSAPAPLTTHRFVPANTPPHDAWCAFRKAQGRAAPLEDDRRPPNGGPRVRGSWFPTEWPPGYEPTAKREWPPNAANVPNPASATSPSTL